jgi:negative regulator of sigma E activity
MIEHRDQLRIQAFLDGELPEDEVREIAERVNRDQELAALMAELRQTRDFLTGAELDLKVPETREFYWSKIQREIRRQEAAMAPTPGPAVGRFAWLRRLLVPASGIGLAALVCLLVIQGNPPTNSKGGMETALADSGAFTYHDYSAGATLVWLSYPADNEVADTDELGTLE